VRNNALLLAALDASGASGASARVIVDATASAPLAARHAEWLARGYHVVTANKALAGGELSGWRALQAATASQWAVLLRVNSAGHGMGSSRR